MAVEELLARAATTPTLYVIIYATGIAASLRNTSAMLQLGALTQTALTISGEGGDHVFQFSGSGDAYGAWRTESVFAPESVRSSAQRWPIGRRRDAGKTYPEGHRISRPPAGTIHAGKGPI